MQVAHAHPFSREINAESSEGALVLDDHGCTTRVATRSFEAPPCAGDPVTQKASSARITQPRAKDDTTIASNACDQVEKIRRSIRWPQLS